MRALTRLWLSLISLSCFAFGFGWNYWHGQLSSPHHFAWGVLWSLLLLQSLQSYCIWSNSFLQGGHSLDQKIAVDSIHLCRVRVPPFSLVSDLFCSLTKDLIASWEDSSYIQLMSVFLWFVFWDENHLSVLLPSNFYLFQVTWFAIPDLT
jgi:hypothetical protein